MSGKQKRGKMIILSSILLATLATAFVIVRLPSFGRLPQGERLERIRQSPNYRDGWFRNQEAGPMMTGDKSRLRGILEFLFRKQEGLRPDDAVPAIRTDLRALDSKSNLLVWFGHSSYLIQAEGRRPLVDPVFRNAAPLSMLNRPFKGTDIYRPEEMPDIDYLIVTHDHWDHLDYRTVRELKERIGRLAGAQENTKHLVADLIDPGDVVVLVTPIDSAAPKGRLILPQQQVIRDILDAGGINVVVKESELTAALAALGKRPKLVITDSQAFQAVNRDTPEDILLTSFSILFARYKGNLAEAVRGAAMLDKLQNGDSVLISEGCTHHRQCGDIGTEKLPNWLKQYTGCDLDYHFTSGREFPQDLSPYALVIHCGGCMLNEREMRSRLRNAADQEIPMTNYGIAIAYMKGILERSVECLGL